MNAVRQVCVCRRYITAENEPNAIAAAVQVHQREPEHRRYVDTALRNAYTFPVPDLRVVRVR